MLEQSLDYFLADKQGADLSDTLIADACQTLRTNREEYLVQIGNETIISKLVEAASLWLSPDYELRKLALAAAPETTGFPREVLAAGLDACFSEWTRRTPNCSARSLATQPGCSRSAVYRVTHWRWCTPQLIAHVAPGHPVPVFSIGSACSLGTVRGVARNTAPAAVRSHAHYVDPGWLGA